MIEALVREVATGRAILFVGAGVSATLGLPAWGGLADQIVKELGIGGEKLCADGPDVRLLAEYYRLEKGSIAELRRWLAGQWDVDDARLLASRVHEIIVALDFPLIYTTNYDSLLERAFNLHGRAFNTVVTAEDVSNADLSLPTIVKFHGDLTDEDSLVVSETDYFRRLSFETPLDIKLAADALGRAVLFVGYSLSDINVRLLL